MAYTEPEMVVSNKDDGVVPATVQPKDASSTPSYSGNNGRADGHGAAEYVGQGANNEILEEEAQSKGTWFAYVKTKQFWLVLVLGQGTLLHFS